MRSVGVLSQRSCKNGRRRETRNIKAVAGQSVQGQRD